MSAYPNDFPSTGNPLVDAAFSRMRERNDARFRAIEEAMLVQAHLEKRWSEQIKGHAEWLEQHEEWLKQHEAAMKRHDEVMSEIDDKLNALIDIMMKRDGEKPH